MARGETGEVDLGENRERVLTLKVDLEGPAEFVSLLKEASPVRMGRRLTHLLPGEFRKHMMAAQREQLLAMRSLLDGVIQRMEMMEKEEKPSRRSVKVDVE